MKIAKTALIAISISAFNAAGWAEEQEGDHKVYECGGEMMKLTELEDGRLALEERI